MKTVLVTFNSELEKKRMQSRSGGLFTALPESILDLGGIEMSEKIFIKNDNGEEAKNKFITYQYKDCTVRVKFNENGESLQKMLFDYFCKKLKKQ